MIPPPHVSRDFHLGLLAPGQYTSHRLRWSSSFHPFHPERLRRPWKGPALPHPGTERPGSASFQAISHTPLCLLHFFNLVTARRGALSGWNRQRGNPPHHAPKPSPRQMALHHQGPVIAGTDPNTLPGAVLPTLVSAAARLSRSRPSVPSVHPSAARHQPPGVKYAGRITDSAQALRSSPSVNPGEGVAFESLRRITPDRQWPDAVARIFHRDNRTPRQFLLQTTMHGGKAGDNV